jgi:pSer/pThr/pTyr-binding forkhead associated (FHA) protein
LTNNTFENDYFLDFTDITRHNLIKNMKRPPVIVVQIVHITGPLKGEIQTFSEGRISIGRNPTCHVHFPPDITCVSRNQADIIREDNQFKVIDHSTNGTFVNGKQVTETYLKNGDILEFSQGGPKVSFLTTIQEMEVDSARLSPSVQQLPGKEVPPRFEKKLIRPARETREEASIQETSTPLIIQYGPTIRSFNKLPVTIGRNPTCDFVLDIPSILNVHAQVFYSLNQYWIKDLTSQRSLRLNRKPIELQAPLTINDEIALSPQGPAFRVVGEGRLAEVSEPVSEKPMIKPQQEGPQAKESEGLLTKFKEYLDKLLR